jgi:hypothetical protein
MTPKEKAKQLLQKYTDLMEFGIWNGVPISVKLNKDMAKQCVLFSVDDILKANVVWYEGSIPNKYWQKVKKEIEKL